MAAAPKALTDWWGKNKTKAIIAGVVIAVVWGYVVTANRPDTTVETIPNGYASADRELLVHASRDSKDAKPLVMILHDNSSSGKSIEHDSDASSYLRTRGAAIVYPEAVSGTWRVGDPADAQYLLDVVRFMADEYTAIDLSRVYIWGFGEGGRLAAEVACTETGRQFAAVAAVGRFDPVTGPTCQADMPHLWIDQENWGQDTTKQLWRFSKDYPGSAFPKPDATGRPTANS